MAAFFTGPEAEERARAYAAWMNEPFETNQQLSTVRKELGELYGIVQRLRALDVRPPQAKVDGNLLDPDVAEWNRTK